MKKLNTRQRQIADGISGLSLEKTNKYREHWGLPPIEALPETREVRGIVRFDQPGILLQRDPYRPDSIKPCRREKHRLMFAPGCFDGATFDCQLKPEHHNQRATASTADGSLEVWQSDDGLEFIGGIHWACAERIAKYRPKQVSPTVIGKFERRKRDGELLIVFQRVYSVHDIVLTDRAAMGDASEWDFLEIDR